MRGTLVREDIGSGSWVLVTTSGKRYALNGNIPSGLQDQTVVVDGDISDEGAGGGGGLFGFGMTGDPVITVKSITAA